MDEYNLLLSSFPDSYYADNARLQIGFIKYDSQDYSGAIIEFQEVLSSYPASDSAPMAQFYTGLCYHRMKLYSEARSAYQKVREIYPEEHIVANAMFEYALTFHDEQNWDQEQIEMANFFNLFSSYEWADEFCRRAQAHIDALNIGHFPHLRY
jgi:tetratricopeptide (TPR) repeat protein